MSDANKLSLARAIHGTPHATRDSFSPSTWAGVERAWAWVEKHYQPKDDPLFLNEYVDRLQRHLAMMREEPKEPTVSEWMPKIKRYVLIGNDEIREDEHGAWWMDEHTASLIRSLRKQPKEPTVKQENEPMSHDAALARVAELEKRGAVDVELPRVETGAVQFDDDWPGVFVRGDNALNYKNAVERAIRVLDGSNLFDAPLVKGQLIGLAKLLASCDAGANGTKPTKIDRKHSRDVRRITREEQAVFAKAYNAATGDFDGWIRAGFRAIGFEVEA